MATCQSGCVTLPAEHTFAKQEIISRYQAIRGASVSICKPLEIEDYVVQPSSDVSPPKWHLAHTTWFFEELVLVKHLTGYVRYYEGFQVLFNSYYKSAGPHWLQAARGQLSRPTVAAVLDYRRVIDQRILEFLSRNMVNEDLLALLNIGLLHEQQHQELLVMDIKVILWTNPSLPVYSRKPLSSTAVDQTRWRCIDEGVYDIGSDIGPQFFDNETPRHKVYITSSAVRDKLVTNKEYLAFILDDGYNNSNLWLSMGLDWVRKDEVRHPMYWFRKANQWFEFTLHGPRPLDMNAPVAHVSYFEADAYARWSGLRLPTEFEMEVYLQKDMALLSAMRNEAEFHPSNTSVLASQLWCWTKSQYSAYPGFRPYEGMLGEYNGKFMCNQFVLRGGCVATPSGHASSTYRNFYRPHQQWLFSGICLAKDRGQ